jgi:hypothetical protein
LEPFWQAFLPNLASTLVGALLGIPLGLWLNRRVVSHGEVLRRDADRVRVAHALQVLARALADNRERLKVFAATLSESKTLFDPALDASAWDAVKGDLTTELSDPALRQQLAYHFSRVQSLLKLNDDYIHFIVGVGASMSSATSARQSLNKVVTGLVDSLASDSARLGQAIEAEQRRLKSVNASSVVAV